MGALGYHEPSLDLASSRSCAKAVPRVRHRCHSERVTKACGRRVQGAARSLLKVRHHENPLPLQWPRFDGPALHSPGARTGRRRRRRGSSGRRHAQKPQSMRRQTPPHPTPQPLQKRATRPRPTPPRTRRPLTQPKPTGRAAQAAPGAQAEAGGNATGGAGGTGTGGSGTGGSGTGGDRRQPTTGTRGHQPPPAWPEPRVVPRQRKMTRAAPAACPVGALRTDCFALLGLGALAWLTRGRRRSQQPRK